LAFNISFFAAASRIFALKSMNSSSRIAQTDGKVMQQPATSHHVTLCTDVRYGK
jgi:hypothetical protein